MKITPENKAILLEALEDMMYKLSLQLDELKGGPLDKQRKELTKKQAHVEKLQHQISIA
ncbi:hypothetical protein [Ekhidna sp.]|uniref:hypothetical protein n=1 Tax=Ekhidna sp. TaxID=2608089 RepID=UPI003CCBE091